VRRNISVALAVGAVGLASFGCARRPEAGAGSSPEPATSPRPPGVRRVTLHVEGMTKVLGIT
jgi:hypothetical protein